MNMFRRLVALSLLVIVPPAFGDTPAETRFAAVLTECLSTETLFTDAEGERPLATGERIIRTTEVSLTTLETGQAILSVEDEARILVRPETTVTLRPDSLLIHRGDTWMRFTKRGSEFKIKCPAALFGIRGTTFRLKVAEDGETELNLYDGSVDIITAGGDEASLAAGQCVRIRPGCAPTILEPTGLREDPGFRSAALILERGTLPTADAGSGEAAPSVHARLKQEGRGTVEDRLQPLNGFEEDLRRTGP